MEEANKVGGTDNITVVIKDIGQTIRAVETANWRPATTFVTLAVTLAFSGYSVNRWINNTYYLAVVDRRVAVWRGLPGALGGHKLGRLENVTNVDSRDLPRYYQSRLSSGLIVGDKQELAALMSDLKQLAKARR